MELWKKMWVGVFFLNTVYIEIYLENIPVKRKLVLACQQAVEIPRRVKLKVVYFVV